MLSFIECSFYLISLFVLGSQLPSRVRLFVPLWTAAPQAPLCMGFSRQEYWSGWPFPSPGDPPDPGIEPEVRAGPAQNLRRQPSRTPLFFFKADATKVVKKNPAEF